VSRRQLGGRHAFGDHPAASEISSSRMRPRHAWDEREGMLDLYLDARATRSAPTSQELALNYIAQHVLGLPSHR
jgi:hypothetical protein